LYLHDNKKVVIKDILRNLSKAFQVVFKRAASLTAKIGNMYVPWHALKMSFRSKLLVFLDPHILNFERSLSLSPGSQSRLVPLCKIHLEALPVDVNFLFLVHAKVHTYYQF
jgi:hypothetical protein